MNHTIALQLAFYGLNKAARGGFDPHAGEYQRWEQGPAVGRSGNSFGGMSTFKMGQPARDGTRSESRVSSGPQFEFGGSGSGAVPRDASAFAKAFPAKPTAAPTAVAKSTTPPIQSSAGAFQSPGALSLSTPSPVASPVAPNFAGSGSLNPVFTSTLPKASPSSTLDAGHPQLANATPTPKASPAGGGVSLASGNPTQMIPASAPDNSAVTGMKNAPGGTPITPGALKAAPASPVGGLPPKPAMPAPKPAAPRPTAAPAARPMPAPAARPAAPATPPPVQNSRMGGLLGSMSNLVGRAGDSMQNAVGGANAKAQNMRTTSMIPVNKWKKRACAMKTLKCWQKVSARRSLIMC